MTELRLFRVTRRIWSLLTQHRDWVLIMLL